MKKMLIVPLFAAILVAAPAATPAIAAPVFVTTNADLVASPFSFTVQGATFTLGGTTDFAAPLTVQNSATGEFSAFGGFLGIPLVPSPSFTNRSLVQYGPDVFGQYGSFTTPTSVNASNGDNFLGFRAMAGGDTYYGFLFTTNGVLNGYGYESSANTAITATTSFPAAAVPEPATWALMIGGFGLAGTMLRRRKSVAAVVYA